MPTRFAPGATPIVEFDPRLEMSPFTLFRRLSEQRDVPLLVDLRKSPSERTLSGAIPWPAEDFRPPNDRDTVLFDEDGARAVAKARELQEAGHARVRALFGGLDLYEFALDPEVVGAETFLEKTGVR